MTNVSVAFGGVRALSDVSLAVGPGQIVGVIGPNGAGKTTLLNVICGLNRPDRGDVWLHGTVVTGWKPSRIAGLGLGRTFQTSQLFPGMTVLENLMTGLHLRGHTGLMGAALRTPSMKREETEMRERALAALAFVGMRRSPAAGPRARTVRIDGADAYSITRRITCSIITSVMPRSSRIRRSKMSSSATRGGLKPTAGSSSSTTFGSPMRASPKVELVPAHDARAVALVDVPERQAPGLRARTVVADELDLRVPAVRRAHGPDVRLRAQHV